MTAPRPWRQQPPDDPERVRVVAMLSAAADPGVPAGAKARVRERLSRGPVRPSRRAGPRLAWAVSAVAVMALLVAVSARWGSDAGQPAPGLAKARTWTTAGVYGQRIALGALGSIALSPASELVRAPEPDAPYVLKAGALELQTLQQGLRIVAGRYEIRPGPHSVLRITAQPFEHVVLEGWAEIRGPDGVRRVQPEAPQLTPAAPAVQAPRRPQRAARAPNAPARGSAALESPRSRPAPPSQAVAGPGGPRTQAAPTPGALYRQARAESRPSIALGLYDQVMNQGGPWAEMAGHQAVRLCVRQGEHAEALRRLGALQRRFPAGAHLPELWLARIDILVAQGRLAQAGPDIERYLKRQPMSLRAPEMYYLRAELHREAGRLTSARADYERVLSGPYADKARAALKALKIN